MRELNSCMKQNYLWDLNHLKHQVLLVRIEIVIKLINMSRNEAGIDRFCIAYIGFSSNIYIVTTYELFAYVLNSIKKLLSSNSVRPHERNLEIWNVGMSISLSLIWVLIMAIVVLSRSNPRTSLKVLVLLLILSGPNLLGWNIFGCIIGSLNNYDDCTTSILCKSEILNMIMRIIAWVLLFFINFVSILGLCCMLVYFIRSLRLDRRIKNWRNTHTLEQELIEAACTICLDNYRVGCI